MKQKISTAYIINCRALRIDPEVASSYAKRKEICELNFNSPSALDT
jgi:hypothetical protein